MANLTFANTHNMVAFLSKSDASRGFDQIVDFLNTKVIQYALVVNPTIYVSCIKQFWATASIKKANDVVKLQALIDRKKRTTWNEFSCSMPSAVICVATDMCYIVLKGYSVGTRENCSSIKDSQAQEEGQEVREEEEIKVFWFKRGKIEAIDADKDITLVDIETQVDLGVELQGRKDDDNDAIKDASAVEPTVFDDEKVTMTTAQTLIKMKAKKARLLDEQMAKRLHGEEVEQAAAREKQEKDDLEKAKVKYQSLKRKPISIAQAKKNMIIYLKNMAGYKMEHFIGMTYDKESFKKLKAVKVLGSYSTQDTPTYDPKEISKEDVQNMLEIIPVSEFKVEALQVNAKLQVEEDSEIARDLVMQIFMKANKPKSRSLDTSSK
nr:hypothetical protein [Tanacetum cinerariifolium]